MSKAPMGDSIHSHLTTYAISSVILRLEYDLVTNAVYSTILQGRRKQSADCQAQLDGGCEAVNNSRAKRSAKFWT